MPLVRFISWYFIYLFTWNLIQVLLFSPRFLPWQVNFWYIKKMLLFVCWFYCLPFCLSNISVFWWFFLGSFKLEIILSANGNDLVSSFPMCGSYIFYCFLCLYSPSWSFYTTYGIRLERVDHLVSFLISEFSSLIILLDID